MDCPPRLSKAALRPPTLSLGRPYGRRHLPIAARSAAATVCAASNDDAPDRGTVSPRGTTATRIA